MKQKQSNEKIRKVFLDELPKRNGKNNQTDWLKCKHLSFQFQWDNLIDTIMILDIKRENRKTKLLLKYKDNEMWMDNGHLVNCKIAMLIGVKTYNYSYKVGDIVKDDKRNIIITKLIRIKEYRAYEYKCLDCGYMGTITESHMSGKRGCPICKNKNIIQGINDVSTTHPHLIKYFTNIKDAYTNSYGSDNEVILKCPDCGFEKKMVIGEFIKNGFACPKCGDGISLGNKIIFNVLEQLIGIDNFQTEYSPEWCKYLYKDKLRHGRYDSYFRLNNKEYIIEMDGGLGHGNKDNNMNGMTKEESKAIDREKDKLAEEHGIENPIRIDCNPSKFDYIQDNILNDNRLNKLFDLNKINWNNVFQYTLTNKMKEACDLWNNGNGVKEIAKMFKMNKGTIVLYLNKGTTIKICNYNGKKEVIKGSAKQVRCIEYNLTFNSVTECAIELSKILKHKCTIVGISNACTGKRKSYYKLHFEYI